MTANPTGIVRWTMAAFHANPDADDDDIVELLEQAGLPHAGHAVAMLPLAFGRRILDGLLELPPTFCELGDDGKVTRESALADDPIFAAADRIARAEATRADLDRIGLRSSEVNAVNNALHQGAKPADLVMSPAMMRLRDEAVPTPAPEVQTILDALLAAHGSKLSLSARTFPRSITKGRGVQLQLDVVVPVGEREVNESFAGMGDTIQAALTEAVDKFARGSLHALLATLDDRTLGADQVDWERWGSFDACLGPMLRMWTDAGPARLGDYLDAIKAAVLAAELSAEIHWLRTFVATNGKEIIGLDMLLDNNGWPPGEAIAKGWPWPEAASYYALRHFLVLVPASTN